MNILVTGSSGYIGGLLAGQLASRGHRVIGVDRRPNDKEALASFIQGDLCDPKVASKAVAGTDCIFHLAASRVDWGVSEEEYFHDNVAASRSVVDAGLKQGVRRWFFYSSVAAIGAGDWPPDGSEGLRPEGPYGRTKAEGEELFRSLGREHADHKIIILRPSAVYGPKNPPDTNVYRLIDAIYKGRFVMVGEGKTRKTTSYIENLLAATLFLFDRMSVGVETFVYVDQPVLTTGELVARIHQLLGRDLPSIRVPEKVATVAGRILDVAATFLSTDFPITGSRIEKFCRETYFDSGAIRQAGFEQPVVNKEALRRTVNWYLDEVAPSL